MYNRIGRGLLIVGRQFRQQLCENASTATGAAGCVTTAVAHCVPSHNLLLYRNYCNKSSDESTAIPPKLMSPDEEAEVKLKEIMALEKNERMRKIIELEIEVMRQNDERVPANLRPRHWYELMKLDSRSKRRHYLEFVWVLEKKSENRQRSKEEKQQKRIEGDADPSNETNIYKLGSNSMFLRFYESSMNHMWNSRLMNRMIFGQQIVLDCGYEKYMTDRELKNCAKQMQLTFAANRNHDDPFDIYLCNANLHGNLMKHFHRFIPPLYNTDFPINIKTESYLDVFDKKKLIYMTPHSNHEMTEFDHDAVYIIGAFVDRSTNEPISLAKAKEEGLRMMKLPLDRHLQWGSSSGKNLTINQVMNILLDLRVTGSWEKALESVPRRKLRENQSSLRPESLNKIQFPPRDEDHTSPVQELKLKDRLIYKPDRSHRETANQDYGSNTARDTMPRQDFTMKSRAKYKNMKN